MLRNIHCCCRMYCFVLLQAAASPVYVLHVIMQVHRYYTYYTCLIICIIRITVRIVRIMYHTYVSYVLYVLSYVLYVLYVLYVCITRIIHIIGGWGGESAAAPTGKSFRFVRACERAGARAARDQLRLPRGFYQTNVSLVVSAGVAFSLFRPKKRSKR